MFYSANEFWRWLDQITIPNILQAYNSERVPVLGVARLRQIRSRQSNQFYL